MNTFLTSEQHDRNESAVSMRPNAVVFAENTLQVSDAMKLAAQYKVPVIAFGVDLSLGGYLLAVQGGISIDVSRMAQLLSINAVRYVTMRENVLALEVVSASGEVIHTGTRVKNNSAGCELLYATTGRIDHHRCLRTDFASGRRAFGPGSQNSNKRHPVFHGGLCG